MATVVLDTVEPQDKDFQKYLAEQGITMEVLNEIGPAGGNPEVGYEGERVALEKMIRDKFYDGSDDDDLNFYLSFIES